MLAAVMSHADDEPQVSELKLADIRRLMVVSGTNNLAVEMMNQMIAVFQQGNTYVPDKFWKDFMSEVDPNELIEMCVPSYDKHFTHDEIKQLIAFYETPLGEKLVKTQPVIMQASMAAGQQWGDKLSERVLEKLKTG